MKLWAFGQPCRPPWLARVAVIDGRERICHPFTSPSLPFSLKAWPLPLSCDTIWIRTNSLYTINQMLFCFLSQCKTCQWIESKVINYSSGNWQWWLLCLCDKNKEKARQKMDFSPHVITVVVIKFVHQVSHCNPIVGNTQSSADLNWGVQLFKKCLKKLLKKNPFIITHHIIISLNWNDGLYSFYISEI